MKKAVIFGVVGLAAMVDRLLPAANEAIRAAAILFYISNEGISLLENAAELGLPLPKGLTDALLQNPCIFGYCYTQLTDVEQEQNGIYTYDRREKFPAEQLYPIFAGKAAIEE